MLCFLPPVPAIRPEPGPERNSPQTARAAQAVILIFVVLNVLFVLTGLLPMLAKNEPRDQAQAEGRSRLADCRDGKHATETACHEVRDSGSPR